MIWTLEWIAVGLSLSVLLILLAWLGTAWLMRRAKMEDWEMLGGGPIDLVDIAFDSFQGWGPRVIKALTTSGAPYTVRPTKEDDPSSGHVVVECGEREIAVVICHSGTPALRQRPDGSMTGQMMIWPELVQEAVQHGRVSVYVYAAPVQKVAAKAVA